MQPSAAAAFGCIYVPPDDVVPRSWPVSSAGLPAAKAKQFRKVLRALGVVAREALDQRDHGGGMYNEG